MKIIHSKMVAAVLAVVFAFGQTAFAAELPNYEPATMQQAISMADARPLTTAPLPKGVQSVGPTSSLSSTKSATVTPPPGSYVDPATGSYAIKVANDFSGLCPQQAGTWAAFEQQVRSYAFQGVNLNNITTYLVFNNKGELKRIEEYVFADSCKTQLWKIVTRFYDLNRQIHLETFCTVKPPKCIGCFCWPNYSSQQISGTFVTRWEIWDAHGNLALADINHKTSDRKYSAVTGKNVEWISTVYDEQGVKTRVYYKTGDNQNYKGIFFNPNGTVSKVEYYYPVVDPAKVWGPFYADPRLANPAIAQLNGPQPVVPVQPTVYVPCWQWKFLFIAGCWIWHWVVAC